MQTALWGSLMTKVSLRRGFDSPLEYQLGLSGTWRWKEVTGIVNPCRSSVGTMHRREKGLKQFKMAKVCGWG